MLLRFRTANHRAFRDAVELSMIAADSRGSAPANGDWTAFTTRVAGVYGANASGKSTLLEAIAFLRDAVRYSATTWGARADFPHRPFAFDRTYREKPSSYEIEFVIDGTRFVYGFESDASGVREEWLHSSPYGRGRMLFERKGDEFTFGRSLTGPNVTISKLTRPTSLFLSAAANNNHPSLSAVASFLTGGIVNATFHGVDQLVTFVTLRTDLEDADTLARAESLVRVADLGITGIELRESTGRGSRPAMDIVFSHGSPSDEGATLSIAEESAGTVAWLTVGVPATRVLNTGGIMVIDEIDASLHPHLVATLIGMFKDRDVNTTGAQLIFSSHDATLLGKQTSAPLGSDEVWFTEKAVDGSTQLFALHEFDTRKDDNFEKRYLDGRYGGVPAVNPIQVM